MVDYVIGDKGSSGFGGFFFSWPNSIRVFRRWMKNALNQDSSYKITGEKRQGMSNFLQSQKLALLPITLPANEGKVFTCCRRTRKTKTEDRKVDIMPVQADAGGGGGWSQLCR